MLSILFRWYVIQGFFLVAWSKVDYLCHESCQCSLTEEDQILATVLRCEKLLQPAQEENDKLDKLSGAEHCNNSFHLSSECYAASNLHIECVDVHLQDFHFNNFYNLSRLTVVNSDLYKLSPNLCQDNHLNFLNISNNIITELDFLNNCQHSVIETLDASHSKLSAVAFGTKSLPNLKSLFLQENDVTDFSSIRNLLSLKVFDASFNPLSFEETRLNEVQQLRKLVLHSVPAVRQFGIEACKTETKCAVLPPNLELLDISSNKLSRIPRCNGLLAGLQNLQVLLLEDNKISVILESSFSETCFNKLKVLSLHNNTIVTLDANLAATLNLQTLVLTNNYLQHMPVQVLKHFTKRPPVAFSNFGGSTYSAQYQRGVALSGNQWSCDCFQIDLYHWLVSQRMNISIRCFLPESLKGQYMRDLNETDLVCSNATVLPPSNATKVHEHDDGTLICRSSGIPKPMVYWETPQGEVLTRESLELKQPSQEQPYSLSLFGEILTVRDVRLSKTGIFRCVANNSISAANSTVGLSVVLSSLSTIIYLVIACFAFIVAIILNSVNMCMYTYEHIQAKRRYQKAVLEQEKEERLNPSIRQRSRAPIDESMASLNADRHYGKYDFTCQQMFLDTVIKGAHSVKKTIYDARHSEFSNNMWGYAASIKDRLHIELPSQLPSISMPSISMPTINMPSIPTMQDINTNIEKLGSSMMTRSHNLATSVGSVFTLKRWIWQQQQQESNSSDENDSKEGSDENLEKVDVETSVNVDVHRTNTDEEESPTTSKQDIREGFRMAFSRLLSNRYDVEINEPCTSKSLPDYTRRRVARNLLSSRKTPPKTVSFISEDITVEPESPKAEPRRDILLPSSAILTISEEIEKPCHSYETSV